MKIENTGLDPTQSSRSNSTKSIDNQTKSERKGEYKTNLNNKDEAAVSDMARLLAKTHQALQETSDVRTGLVEDIRKKIQDGSYEIPVEELAKRLLERL